MKFFALDPDFSAGGQPSAEELRELAEKGFRSVINLRREGEADQNLSPLEEGATAAAVGLGYEHLPVSLDDLQTAQLDRFRAAMAALPSPVYIHCRGGGRARTFALVHRSISEGKTGAQAAELLTQAGLLEESDAKLREQLAEYVDRAQLQR